MEARLEALEKQVAEMNTGKSKKEKVKRAPSAYNEFVRVELEKIKNKMGSSYNHKEAFKLAAAAWSKQKEQKV